MVDRLVAKKKPLLKRKIQLTRAKASKKMSLMERSSHIEQYDYLICRLTNQQSNLQSFCADLERLEKAVMTLPEYHLEKEHSELEKLTEEMDHKIRQLDRIEKKLEEKVDKINRYDRRPTDRRTILVINS